MNTCSRTALPLRKHASVLAAAFAITLGLAGAAPLCLAVGLPVPSFVYFGQVSDTFGWPFLLTDSASVIAYRANGLECGRAPVDEAVGPVLNYRLEIAMAEGSGPGYASYAVTEGERIMLVVEAGGARYPVGIPAQLAPVGHPGQQVRQDLSLGHDSDQDGLPDEWEEWLIANSGGALKSIADVRPGDDFDGDGATNWEEFLAGTNPAWAEDLPLLEHVQLEFVDGQVRVAVAVLTVPGRTYRILSAPTVGQGPGVWTPQLLAFSAAADPQQSYWRGDGQLTWVYLRSPEKGQEFMKLEVR